MKKTLILMAAASAFVLTGCTETDLSGDTSLAKETTSAIQFSAKTRDAGTTRVGIPGIITTTELKTETHKDEGFSVFGYYTNTSQLAYNENTGISGDVKPNFMYNQQVKWDGTSKWSYSPVKYWPNGIDAANAESAPSNTATEDAPQYLSFFAYAPYVAVTANSGAVSGDANGGSTYGIIGVTSNATANDPKITYKFKDGSTSWDLSAANNVDLLWGLAGSSSGKSTYDETDNTDVSKGTTEYNINLTKQSVNETVDFYFKHALAKFGGYDNSKSYLKVVADIDGNSDAPTTSGFGTKDATTLITINSLTIKTSADANKVYAGGVFDIATGKWDVTTPVYLPASTTLFTSTTSTANINKDVWEPATPSLSFSASKWTQGTGEGSYEIAGVEPTSLKGLFTGDVTPFYMIPASGSQELQVTVSYTVRTYDANLDATAASGETNGTWTKVTQTITNKVTIPSIQVNKVYTLVMHLGLTSVKFSAEVANWEDKTGENDNIEVVWLPSNVVNETSTTVTSGSDATAFVAATAGTFAINLTGLTENAVLTVTSSDGTNAGVTASQTATGTSHTVNVNLIANGGAARSFTITITDTSAEPDKVTTVVINQAAGS